METIVAFFEEYWGLTIIGGVTLGGIITLAVYVVMFAIRLRAMVVESQTQTNVVNTLMAERKVFVERSEIDSKIHVVTFKALSYLTAASKLPLEDKLAIQSDFLEVKNLVIASVAKSKELAKMNLAAVTAAVQDKPAPTGDTAPKVDAGAFVQAAVDGAVSLIDKYAKSGGK